MRINDDTRFPHPVLSPGSGDFGPARFDVALLVDESPSTEKVRLKYSIELDQPAIRELVASGRAQIGAFVRCQDTYFSSLERMDWPHGEIDFVGGTLLNRVAIRPMIWLCEPLSGWAPDGLTEEFSDPVDLDAGAIIGFDVEYTISVGRAKLAPLESIFALKQSDAMGPDTLAVDLTQHKITILAGTSAFGVINGLRAAPATRSAATAAVYLPVVMEVLDQLRAGQSSFEDRRWFEPFRARCDHLHIELDSGAGLFEDAQKLLNHPIVSLNSLLGTA